jgi:glycosyltransferase involved in cell wall biosynthesis
VLDKIGTRVTVIVPVQDGMGTLPTVLGSLGVGQQSLPVRLLMCDNGSVDGTWEWLQSDTLRSQLQSRGIQDYVLLEQVPSKKRIFQGQELRSKNLEHMLCKFCLVIEKAPTDYVLSLDADVVIPRGALRDLVENMDDEPKLGALGLIYDYSKNSQDWVSDHVKRGCTMYRWKALKEIADDGFGTTGCVCRYIHEELEIRGWWVRHLEPERISARHLRLEGGA